MACPLPLIRRSREGWSFMWLMISSCTLNVWSRIGLQFAQMTFLTVVKIKRLLIWACVSTYRSRIQGITAVVNLPALLKLWKREQNSNCSITVDSASTAAIAMHSLSSQKNDWWVVSVSITWSHESELRGQSGFGYSQWRRFLPKMEVLATASGTGKSSLLWRRSKSPEKFWA